MCIIILVVTDSTTEFVKNHTSNKVLHITVLTSMVRAAIVFLDIFLIDKTNSSDPSASRANRFLNIRFNISAFYDELIDCNNLTDLPENATFICYKYTININLEKN